MVEAFKWAYAERSTLGDPSDEEFADQINEVHQNFNWQYPSYIGNRSLTIFYFNAIETIFKSHNILKVVDSFSFSYFSRDKQLYDSLLTKV